MIASKLKTTVFAVANPLPGMTENETERHVRKIVMSGIKEMIEQIPHKEVEMSEVEQLNGDFILIPKPANKPYKVRGMDVRRARKSSFKGRSRSNVPRGYIAKRKGLVVAQTSESFDNVVRWYEDTLSTVNDDGF